jgi:hypothetical protein
MCGDAALKLFPSVFCCCQNWQQWVRHILHFKLVGWTQFNESSNIGIGNNKVDSAIIVVQ